MVCRENPDCNLEHQLEKCILTGNLGSGQRTACDFTHERLYPNSSSVLLPTVPIFLLSDHRLSDHYRILPIGWHEPNVVPGAVPPHYLLNVVVPLFTTNVNR